MMNTQELAARRTRRVRAKIKKTSVGRPRLSVFRSNKNIYAQIIDDAKGVTVAAASTLDAALRESLKSGCSTDAAVAVGKLLAQRGVAAGVTSVVFDRGGYMYHGRVKALAEAAREGGLAF